MSINEKLAETYWPITGTALFSTALIIGVVCAVKAIFASGQVDYCYVQNTVYSGPVAPNLVVYHLVGHVPWRADRTIATNLSSVEDAHAKAQLIGCSIK